MGRQDLAQRVGVEAPRLVGGHESNELYRSHAETDLVTGVANSVAVETVALLNARASLSALVFDPDRRTVVAHCAAIFRADNHVPVGQILTQAAAIQAADAADKAPALARALGGSVAQSAHPTRGPRDRLAPSLTGLLAGYRAIAAGEVEPATLASFDATFAADVAPTLAVDPPPWVVASDDAGTLTAEFECVSRLTGVEALLTSDSAPPGTAILRTAANVEHPDLGRGRAAPQSRRAGRVDGQQPLPRRLVRPPADGAQLRHVHAARRLRSRLALRHGRPRGRPRPLGARRARTSTEY